MTLGQRLKWARKKSGYSNQDVPAEKIGLTGKTLSNYERDYRSPDPETLKKLAELYDVSTDFLVGKEEKDKPKSKLDQTVNEAIEQLKNEETLLFMKDDDIDEETAKLIKQALINGIKYVDAMKKKE
ncbi:helix-turn-helix domain-containing protein [Bacillus sp. NEAU-CP5]|uniref:XRE family transcriptional regulator n=1 Tax=Bacillus siamensis TaxID=659243 RepID=A0AAI8HJU6_9BACI|nr:MULTISPECIES: helix-turn-helix domain-containing protein [Bacillus]MBL3611721.1 helix-turn-helix transcriptional regulator [Bacillus sp. RHFS18]ATO09439.1 transcriptional regulator [Bacillus velezensis]AUJ75347.1 XRE family transcriptional regulator [Bacillus siamensis]KAF6544827.1 helix-turn-helix transcriptional regulator [Bacillus sp. EKM206B]KAF6549973.1 helix-turn-helix transcriptional regulator [Bacillus sp. EKM207B]